MTEDKLNAINWQGLIDLIKSLIAALGPEAKPIIEAMIAALPIPSWTKAILMAFVEALLKAHV